ncbi:hypothetical protein [Saccharomonospora viridis]|uniref:hypothetical protein n=1 Tax=Saccharomonospora viridis TaxID=1852 RepID=UPI00240A474D|nr:hypothetical protein [Saccharomonospora viridis]
MTNDLIDAIADDEDLCGTCGRDTGYEATIEDDDGVVHHFRCWGHVCQRCGEDIVNPEDVYDTGMDLYHDWCVNDEDVEHEDDDY